MASVQKVLVLWPGQLGVSFALDRFKPGKSVLVPTRRRGEKNASEPCLA